MARAGVFSSLPVSMAHWRMLLPRPPAPIRPNWMWPLAGVPYTERASFRIVMAAPALTADFTKSLRLTFGSDIVPSPVFNEIIGLKATIPSERLNGIYDTEPGRPARGRGTSGTGRLDRHPDADLLYS